MSITFNQLANIGIHAPIGSVSFHTVNGEKIVYLIGETSQFIEKTLTKDSAEMLKNLYKMGGSLGWEITGAGKI